jgi:ubiquinone/menaquinone biosynthesis C-methylase UbiE
VTQLAYNSDYWSKKVESYFEEDWAHQPSPFSQEVSRFIKPKSTLLELGTGAGQDGLWFAERGQDVTLSDGVDGSFDSIQNTARNKGLNNISLVKFDLTGTFPFPDSSFDVVYAQLVLHYFNDNAMSQIVNEIYRVLNPGGVFAMMANSQKDEEYNPDVVEDNLINIKGISKRFFTTESLKPFVRNFEELLLDENGRTPKDDAVNNSGMVRFIGRKV